MNRIIRRVFAILPAVLVQVLWLLVLFHWLAPWAGLIHAVLSVLALLFVLYIITKQDESTYKILWLLVILTFPLPGALLYLLFGNKRTTRPLQKKLNHAPPLLTDRSDAAPLHEALSAENERLAQTFRWLEEKTGFALHANRTAEYYSLGDQMFPDILAELKKAERFIFVEYFIIENGLMWDSITEILAEKSAQGVDVRVMYDDLGSISTYAKADAEKLKKKGIHCAAFNPLVLIKGTLNYRDHRKMLIIDGKVAFSGGVNLADEYINHIEKCGGELHANVRAVLGRLCGRTHSGRIPDGGYLCRYGRCGRSGPQLLRFAASRRRRLQRAVYRPAVTGAENGMVLYALPNAGKCAAGRLYPRRAQRGRRADHHARHSGQKAGIPHVPQLLSRAFAGGSENLRIYAGLRARQGLPHRRHRRNGGNGKSGLSQPVPAF